MKTIKSVDVKSFVAYGAVVAALWTCIFGLWYWLLGWLFGATSWWIDVNIGNLTVYSMYTFTMVFFRALIAAVAGAIAGWIIALVYNAVAGMMGGIKINLG